MRRREAGIDEGPRQNDREFDTAPLRHWRKGGGQRLEHRLQGEGTPSPA